jgi:CheY-like chemotaxis protein
LRTVLIVDPDLGFLLWLGQLLVGAGYVGLPAQTVREATALIGKLNLIIDLLIIDPTVAGAAEFVRSMRREQGHVRVIAVITSMTELDVGIRGVDAVRPGPTEADDLEASEWLRTIQHLLAKTLSLPPGFSRDVATRPPSGV